MKTVFIITNPTDHAVSQVTAWLERFGQRYVRLHPNELDQQNAALSVRHSQEDDGFVLNCDGHIVRSDEIISIWHRQPFWNSLRSDTPAEEEFIQQEWRYSIWSMITTTQSYWVNHPFWAVSLLEHNKLYQLKRAAAIGLAVPDTLISNNPEAICTFSEQHGNIVAVKPVHNQIILDDQRNAYGIYTQVLTTVDIRQRQEHVRISPMIIQEYVAKAIEIRVTIIGHHIFACEIHSQNSDRTKHDWRRYDFANVKHAIHKLPPDIESKLLKLMQLAHLNYGAIDLILTPDGKYVFLEVNPSGQYGWIEELTAMPISQTFAEALMNPKDHGIRALG